MNYQITEPQLIKKISKRNQERRLIADSSIPHLTKWLNSDKFSMDKPRALAYLNINYEKDSRSYHKRLNFIKNFKQHLLKYFRDGKDDRLHSLFTHMPSDLKPFVLYNGQNLVEIDITNSQPLFIVLFLKDIRELYNPFNESKPLFKELKKRIRDILSRYINNKYQCDYIIDRDKYRLDINKISINISTILLKNSEPLDFTDILLFEKLVIEGSIYEHTGKLLIEKGSVWKDGSKYKVKLFNKVMKRQETIAFPTLRKCVKTVVLNALYSPANTRGIRAINDLKYAFPNLFTILNAMKENDSKDFPIFFQRMEAKFILDECSKRLSKKYPNMPLISRHDSLSTTEEYGDLLLIEFRNIFCEYLGFPAELKKEPW